MSTFTLKDARHDTKDRRLSERRSKPAAAPGLFGVRSWKKSRLAMGIVFGLAAIFPLVYMVSLSFQPTSDILTSNAVIFPSHPTTANYIAAWSQNSFS